MGLVADANVSATAKVQKKIVRDRLTGERHERAPPISLNQTGQLVVRRNLNIQPTLTIRPGFTVRVIVNRDLVLEPYRGSESIRCQS